MPRAVEQSVAFTLCVFEKVLAAIEELGASDGVDTVLSRSDLGPHDRCKRVLAMGNRWMQQLRQSSRKSTIKVRARFGCEHHSKNGVDRTLAGWNKRSNRYEKHSPLRSTADVITCFQVGCRRQT